MENAKSVQPKTISSSQKRHELSSIVDSDNDDPMLNLVMTAENNPWTEMQSKRVNRTLVRVDADAFAQLNAMTNEMQSYGSSKSKDSDPVNPHAKKDSMTDQTSVEDSGLTGLTERSSAVSRQSMIKKPLFQNKRFGTVVLHRIENVTATKKMNGNPRTLVNTDRKLKNCTINFIKATKAALFAACSNPNELA